jgi:tetratricopeptide (TPR) repeat protein
MDNQEPSPAGYGEERKAFLAELEGCFDRNELEAALDLARGRLRKSPADPDARVGICRALLHLGRIDEAGEALDEVEEIIATLSQIYACIGDLCIKKGMEDSAEEFYRRSMILNPGAHWARDILERLKGIEEPGGTAAGERSGEDAGIPSDFRTPTLAELLIRQGHLQDAGELLEKIVGQEPQNEKASGLLQEVRGLMVAEAAEKRNAGIVSELSRWLDNIGRVRGHAA